MKWENHKFIDYLDVKKNEIKTLPPGVSISTMCGKIKLGTKLNIQNIFNYFKLDKDDILTIKCNSTKSLIPIKKKRKKPKKNAKFYNQITLVIRVDEGAIETFDKVPKVNLKIFQNGSIQMSGIQSVYNVNRVLNKLVYFLNSKKGIKLNDSIKKIEFIESKINISDFAIYMINSNYKIKYEIDRNKLYELLKLNDYKCTFEKCIRACVIVKFKPEKNNLEEKEISIFIFQKGNIIITGARNVSNINESYHYINKFLFRNLEEIYKETDEYETELLFKLHDEVIKNYGHKIAVV